jgi:ATP-dependent DNA helicase MPH1
VAWRGLADTTQLDLDAELSGSDSGDEPSSDVESESDRLFANDFQPTQAPRGYDQRAAYVAGLSTQAGPAHGLRFAHANREREGWMGKARKPVYVTDDEQGSSASENEYELGSFVCPDEEDLSFASE